MNSRWNSCRFGDLLEGSVRNGIYKKKEFHGAGARIVNMGELFAYPRLRDVEMKRVQLTSNDVQKALLNPGDLIFARRSLVAEGAGKCSIVMEVTEPTTFESSIIRARPNKDKADSLFLYYLFNSSVGKQALGSILRQVAVSGITGADLANLELPIPPMPEQHAIAEVLGALDDKIELNRRMNATLDELARTIFRSWFVDFDPVHAKAEGREPFGMDAETAALFPDCFTDSELGPIPEGWEVSRLDEILQLQRGFDLPTTQRTPGPFPVIAASGPSGSHNAGKAQGPGVVTGRSGVIGNVYYVDDDFWPLNTTLWVREFRHSTPIFAFMLLRGMDLSHFGTGSAVPTLNRNHIHGNAVIKPDMRVIKAYQEITQPLMNLAKSNREESRTLAELRDTLLPELISGRIRVPEAEKLVGEAV